MSEIQSVIFKKKAWSPGQAILWLYKHDLKFNKIDEKEKTYRFRQQDPSNFNHYVTKKLKNGIDLVIGYY